MDSFQIEKTLFPFHTRGKAGERAAFSDDPMARYEDQTGISANGLTHGTDGFGAADVCGDLSVGFGAAAGHLTEGLPYLHLKRCSSEIQRHRKFCSYVNQIFL